MYQKERLDELYSIIKENGYVTVKYLVSALHYSNATINRDLNILEGQKLIKRSYGGVEYIEKQAIPLPFRYHKMKKEKHRIGKIASDAVCDGDTIFIDASTTAEFMTEYLTEKKDLTVITNNLAIVTRLSEYNIKVICLGGKVLEPPYMLCGIETVENAMKYKADKMFFSTWGVSNDGVIANNSEAYSLLHKTMVKNSNQVYYLFDHEKIDNYPKCKYFFDSFESVDCVISDYEFTEKVKNNYKNTKFIKV